MLVERATGRSRLLLAILFLALGGTLTFAGDPLAMVGGAYIILFAFAVRSLPASVRSGVASLQPRVAVVKARQLTITDRAVRMGERLCMEFPLPAGCSGGKARGRHGSLPSMPTERRLATGRASGAVIYTTKWHTHGRGDGRHADEARSSFG